MAKLEIGVLVGLGENPEGQIRKVADLGLKSCQVGNWNPDLWTDEIGRKLVAATAKFGVNISAIWAGYGGPAVWDFLQGPATIGLVPDKYRAMRVQHLKKAAEFAGRFNLNAIVTHVGFLPEDPNDPQYDGIVQAIFDVADHARKHNAGFWFETGQETPVTVLRTIERVNTGNLGVNLDTANLILYGKANPVDALDVFGQYVRGMHAKDGKYPTDGTHLGEETPIGEGKVDFAAVLGKLKQLGYTGAVTIEREIEGEKQIADIKRAVKILDPLC